MEQIYIPHTSLSIDDGISCVYLLTNKLNGKIYVGKANDLKSRIYNHIQGCKNPKKTSAPIVNALHKHGFENFSLRILEMCCIEDLMTRETHYIDTLNARDTAIGYNVLRNGFDRTGIRHRKSVIDRISATSKVRAIRGDDHWTRKYPDSNQNIRKAHARNVGKPRPQSLKDAVSRAWLGKKRPQQSKPIMQLHPITNELIKTWPSLYEATAGVGGKSSAGITATMNGKLNGRGYPQYTAYGFKWKFA